MRITKLNVLWSTRGSAHFLCVENTFYTRDVECRATYSICRERKGNGPTACVCAPPHRVLWSMRRRTHTHTYTHRNARAAFSAGHIRFARRVDRGQLFGLVFACLEYAPFHFSVFCCEPPEVSLPLSPLSLSLSLSLL